MWPGFCALCVWGGAAVCGSGGEGEFRGALREYREGLGSRAGVFRGLRFDPYDDNIRDAES